MNSQKKLSLFSPRFGEGAPKGVKLVLLSFFSLGILFLFWHGIHGKCNACDFHHRYDIGILIRHGLAPAEFADVPRSDLPKMGLPPNFAPQHIDFPWTQSVFAVFSLFPRTLALTLFRILQAACLIFCIAASVHYLTAKFHIERLSASVLVLFFYLSLYIRTDVNVGNLGLVSLAGIFLLYYGWDRKKSWLEAVGLTLLCMKPQTGFLFILLLMFDKHIAALVWTGVYSFLISIPLMLYLHKIPWDFFVKMVSVRYTFSTLPQTCGLFGIFYQPHIQQLTMAGNAIVTVGILFFYLYRYPVKDPMLRLLPAAVGTLCWSYLRIYHFLFLIIPLLCLAGMLKESAEEGKSSCMIVFLMFLLWLPVGQHVPTCIFFMKFLISFFSLFYIGHYFGRTRPL